jgi:hypothetical protein
MLPTAPHGAAQAPRSFKLLTFVRLRSGQVKRDLNTLHTTSTVYPTEYAETWATHGYVIRPKFRVKCYELA